MAAALGWGALAASSLILGALLGLARPWPNGLVGAVLAFGAGALISAVSFDLAQEGVELGGGDAVALGLAVGAIAYFVANRAVEHLGQPRGAGPSDASAGSADAGPALALGAFLDGILEQMVLGIGLALGEGVSVGLLAAIFISNLPEAIGSASAMDAAGRSHARIARLWIVVAVICTLASVVGYGIADTASDDLQAAINGFAAGALLVMLVDSMIPERPGRPATSRAWSPCSVSPSLPPSPASVDPAVSAAPDRPDCRRPGACRATAAHRRCRPRGDRAAPFA